LSAFPKPVLRCVGAPALQRVPPHNFRVDLTSAPERNMRRSASCTWTTRRSAGLSGRDVRHVVAGARGAPARALHVDNGVDAGPRLRREMRRLLESRVSHHVDRTECSRLSGSLDLGDRWRAERDFREIESGSRCGSGHGSRLVTCSEGIRDMSVCVADRRFVERRPT